jgi:RNA polymerase sigma-70 factor (ECF subfamily)
MYNVMSDHGQSAEVRDTEIVVNDVLESAQAGSHAAFEALQNKYSRRLFKQIVAITRHHEDAEDALQETFCNAYVALPRFEGRCHVYTWLSRIAINCALMKVRKRRIQMELSFDDQDGENGEKLVFEIPDQGRSPEELFRVEESVRHLTDLIASLDPISRLILDLRLEREYSIDEIAKVLSVSVSAVKARLYRAKHFLRIFLPAARHKHATS